MPNGQGRKIRGTTLLRLPMAGAALNVRHVDYGLEYSDSGRAEGPGPFLSSKRLGSGFRRVLAGWSLNLGPALPVTRNCGYSSPSMPVPGLSVSPGLLVKKPRAAKLDSVNKALFHRLS
jgi:hypothetical protein